MFEPCADVRQLSSQARAHIPLWACMIITSQGLAMSTRNFISRSTLNVISGDHERFNAFPGLQGSDNILPPRQLVAGLRARPGLAALHVDHPSPREYVPGSEQIDLVSQEPITEHPDTTRLKSWFAAREDPGSRM